MLRCIEGSPYEETQRQGPPSEEGSERAKEGKTERRKEEFGGFWGPASWVGIPFEILDFVKVLGPS